MIKPKPSILFLSASSAVFDTIPEECFGICDFHLLKITPDSSIEERLSNKDLLIVDTYSLGMDFLDKIMPSVKDHALSILIVDDFNEDAIIRQIFERGAKGYLNIDEYGDRLKSKIQRLLPNFSALLL